jgi:hypothetical protein
VASDDDMDPFEGLVLDEDFIRGAKAYEPPARTREAMAKHTPEPPRQWSPEKAKRRSTNRVWLITLTVIAGLVGIAYVAQPHDSAPSSTLVAPQESSDASPRPSGSATEDPTIDDSLLVVGGCYTWRQGVQDTVATPTKCTASHLFEYVLPATLTGYDHADFPTEPQWDAHIARLCDKGVQAYLHHVIDPDGRLYVGAIRPTHQGWAQGSRGIDCGVQTRTVKPFGPGDDLIDASTGRADGSQQALLYPVGTCLRYSGKSSGSVPCTAPHSVEVVGSTTVRKTGALPSEAAFDRLLSSPCRAQISSYVGHRFQQTSREYVGWDQLGAPSWAAGTREVNCYLSFSTAGKRTDVTGSHRTTGKSA